MKKLDEGIQSAPSLPPSTLFSLLSSPFNMYFFDGIRYDNGEDIDVQPNFQRGGSPFGGGGSGPFHFSFNFGG